MCDHNRAPRGTSDNRNVLSLDCITVNIMVDQSNSCSLANTKREVAPVAVCHWDFCYAASLTDRVGSRLCSSKVSREGMKFPQSEWQFALLETEERGHSTKKSLESSGED